MGAAVRRSRSTQQLPIVQDPELNRYINVLGDSIARLTSRTDSRDVALLHGEQQEVNAFARARRLHLREPRPGRADGADGPVRGGPRRTRSGTWCCATRSSRWSSSRARTSASRSRACSRASATTRRARRRSTWAARRCSRSSAARRSRGRRGGRRRTSFARASTRTACRRCSRSCSTSGSRARRPRTSWFADHPLEEDRIAATRAHDRADTIRRSSGR